ncbi:hypothetical protein PtA15_13A311 [Puccinia triticina]|uniref:Uncharacterized protein n=1 Tax=Puccinia triticina TaxID=208348 RepID=A0ABY7D3J9_9BASI|nr:uncharacterized protein PtA15_13A311 [Puccinia triticina]WAQ90911.1 hypothetical protein PtA15_13A311 [Puccinia triticina]
MNPLPAQESHELHVLMRALGGTVLEISRKLYHSDAGKFINLPRYDLPLISIVAPLRQGLDFCGVQTRMLEGIEQQLADLTRIVSQGCDRNSNSVATGTSVAAGAAKVGAEEPQNKVNDGMGEAKRITNEDLKADNQKRNDAAGIHEDLILDAPEPPTLLNITAAREERRAERECFMIQINRTLRSAEETIEKANRTIAEVRNALVTAREPDKEETGWTDHWQAAETLSGLRRSVNANRRFGDQAAGLHQSERNDDSFRGADFNKARLGLAARAGYKHQDVRSQVDARRTYRRGYSGGQEQGSSKRARF